MILTISKYHILLYEDKVKLNEDYMQLYYLLAFTNVYARLN